MVLMIVSGRSGSGKSVALRALEDMGFYCVDNLPVVLLPDLARTLADREISAAVSIDVRNMPESPEIFEQAMSNLPDAFSPQLLFLDADRNTLIRRYSDTRRLHPLSSKNLSLESAIDKESDLLEPLRSRADLIVDTSEMSVHELAEMLRTRLLGKRERELTMVFESFEFFFMCSGSGRFELVLYCCNSQRSIFNTGTEIRIIIRRCVIITIAAYVQKTHFSTNSGSTSPVIDYYTLCGTGIHLCLSYRIIQCILRFYIFLTGGCGIGIDFIKVRAGN